MLIALRAKLIHKRRQARDFSKGEDGAAAVEFALVALPFFGMIFAIMELGIFFFASRFMEDGVFNAGRKALTQQLSATSSCSDFANNIKTNVGTWFDQSKLVINVTILSSFSGSAAPLNLADAGCQMGASGQTILIQAAYPYPFTAFRIMGGSATDLNLRAATALRVE